MHRPDRRGIRGRAAADRRRDGRARVETLNRLELPLAVTLEPRLGEIQRLTPTVDALYVPDIDTSLDEQTAKQDFWKAFRPLGDWYADQPPYSARSIKRASERGPIGTPRAPTGVPRRPARA